MVNAKRQVKAYIIVGGACKCLIQKKKKNDEFLSTAFSMLSIM